MDKNYILFLDSINRTILAGLIQDTTDKLVVINPVVIQMVNDQQNKMKIQTIPLLFRELQKNPEEDLQWSYNPANITRIDSKEFLSEKLIKQYEFVVGLTPAKAAELSSKKSEDTPLVKLFDENNTNG